MQNLQSKDIMKSTSVVKNRIHSTLTEYRTVKEYKEREQKIQTEFKCTDFNSSGSSIILLSVLYMILYTITLPVKWFKLICMCQIVSNG